MRKVADLIRPSSAHKWLNCLGSPYMEAKFDDSTSAYAREGSLAHWVAQCCLEHSMPAEKYVGHTAMPDEFKGMEIDADMAYYVQRYADYVTALPGQLFVEHQLPFKSLGILPNNGTSDAVKVDWENKHAYVVDLKFGKGMQVDAEGNYQLMLYALGVVLTLEMLGDIDTVTLVIHQPRLDHVSVWELSRGDLTTFAERVEAATQVFNRDDYSIKAAGMLTPGAHCSKFCSALPTCKAAAEYNFALVSNEFESIADVPEAVLTPLGELSLADLDATVRRVAEIKKWCDAVKAHVEEMLLRGIEVPGQKLVEGRSSRRWADEAVVEALLKSMRSVKEDQYTKKTLLTAPALEKALTKAVFSKKGLNDHVVKPKGSPTLVVEEDPRPSIGLTIGDFEVIGEIQNDD